MTQTTTTDSFRRDILFRFVLSVFVLAGAGFFFIGGVSLVPDSPAGAGLGYAFFLIAAVLAVIIFRRSFLFPRRATGWFTFWWVVSCLSWGVISQLVVVVQQPIQKLVDYVGWEDAQFAWGGAYPEEIFKAVGVVVVLFSFRTLTKPWHGLLTGLFIGFADGAFENTDYTYAGALADPNSDLHGAMELLTARLAHGTLFLHIATTALAGWGIGWAVFATTRPMWKRVGCALSCFMGAFLFHFGWNYRVDTPFVMAHDIIFTGGALVIVGYLIWRAHRIARKDRAERRATEHAERGSAEESSLRAIPERVAAP